jgi:hypothetical protein
MNPCLVRESSQRTPFERIMHRILPAATTRPAATVGIDEAPRPGAPDQQPKWAGPGSVRSTPPSQSYLQSFGLGGTFHAADVCNSQPALPGSMSQTT